MENEYICDICGEIVSFVEKFTLNTFDGFCESSVSIKLCMGCSCTHTYANEHHYDFLHYVGNLYIARPSGLYYDRVYGQEQIDEAFNPDYAAFKEWNNNFIR